MDSTDTDRLVETIDRVILQLEQEQSRIHRTSENTNSKKKKKNKGKKVAPTHITDVDKSCSHPVKDIGSSFDYLLNSAFTADRRFYNCMAKSHNKKTVRKCFDNLIDDIDNFECQKLKQKVFHCGSQPSIPKETVSCLAKASNTKKVKKCVGKSFEQKLQSSRQSQEVDSIDEQLREIRAELQSIRKPCIDPVKTVSQAFDYLLNSAFKTDKDLYTCMAKATTNQAVHQCFNKLSKDITKLQCGQLEKKVKQCGKSAVIPNKALKCLIKANSNAQVRKCIGTNLEHLDFNDSSV